MPQRTTRWPYALLAYLCTALALAGVLLPGLPTVPFLLVAAWGAGRGSERLDRWLRSHRQLGPLLHCWERERAIPGRAKQWAVVLLAFSWLWMAWKSSGPWVPAGTALLFIAVAAYVLTRPTPSQSLQPPAGE